MKAGFERLTGEGIKGFVKRRIVKDTAWTPANILMGDLTPYTLTGGGKFALGAFIVGGTAISTGLASRNRGRAGKMTYKNGMTRMTGSFNSGAVEAMKRGSHGDYAVFADMVKRNTLHNFGIANKLEHIDDYGADAAFVSALYGMGG